MMPAYRRKQWGRLARGLHPFGMNLAYNGKKCGDCASAEGHGLNMKKWYKCARMVNSGGPGTDLLVRWPACELFEEK